MPEGNKNRVLGVGVEPIRPATNLPLGPFALSDIKTGLRNQLVRQYSLDVHLAVEEGVTASISQP